VFFSKNKKVLNSLTKYASSFCYLIKKKFDSFSLRDCTGASVTIVIPSFVRDLSLRAYIETGKIKFDTQEFSTSTSTSAILNKPRIWKTVNLGLHTGLISIGRLSAQHSINVHTKLGVVHSDRLDAPFINVSTTTGAVEIKYVCFLFISSLLILHSFSLVFFYCVINNMFGLVLRSSLDMSCLLI
jgi:hypothetical protein